MRIKPQAVAQPVAQATACENLRADRRLARPAGRAFILPSLSFPVCHDRDITIASYAAIPVSFRRRRRTVALWAKQAPGTAKFSKVRDAPIAPVKASRMIAEQEDLARF